MKTRLPLDMRYIRTGVSEISTVSEIRYFSEIESTHEHLTSLPDAELHHGLTVLADFQSHGRGRRGAQWCAPARTSVLMSVALHVPTGIRPLDLLMVAGLAAADSIQDVTGLPSALKWPNDVLVHESKVCGVLAESLQRSTGLPFVVLGIGVNVNMSRLECEAMSPFAASLSELGGAAIRREDLVVQLFKRLNLWYRSVTRDPDAVFAAWKGRLHTLNRLIVVNDGSDTWQGVATEVQRDGGLVVRQDDGSERVVYAANVSLSGAAGFTREK